jgi:hypothetical protein
MTTLFRTIPASTTTQSAPEGGLSLTELLAALPTDPASIFALLLFAGSVALVIWFGRPRGGKGGKPA